MKTHNMSQHRLKRIGTLGLVVLIFASALGCNTAQGFGKDMEKAGQKIQQGTD
jgi:predicted small secreted protein